MVENGSTAGYPEDGPGSTGVDKAAIRARIDEECGLDSLSWRRAEPEGEHIEDALEIAEATLDEVTYLLVRRPATIDDSRTEAQRLPLVFTPEEREAFLGGVDDGDFGEIIPPAH
ncbi:hypothetical protein [Sciscionella marina]|uniref:hypothetical protein n=1 Tax=Sciscionella marina TaxID=508770 RepID=UPI0003659349|nr:hypothetical protein [Sciscionella marina]